MNKPLNILIVEDSEDDALLLLRELRKGGYDPVFERVDTAGAMQQALRQRPWDIVVSDYLMPKFSGTAALAVLHDSGLDLPFIIVSGNIGEDIAVGAMKAGAHDYIIKGNLSRLIPAIERELRDAEVRRERARAEHSLRTIETQYRLLFENSLDAVLLMTPDGSFLAANAAACGILNMTEEEIIKTGKYGILDPADRRVQILTEERQRTGRTSGEVTLLRKDGTRVPCELSSAQFTDKDGNVRVSIIARDITDRKKAEGRESLTNAMLALFQKKYTRMEYLDEACALIRAWSGFRNVGIRVINQDSMVPFASCRGYTGPFLESESDLSLIEDHCICTRVIAGTIEPPDRCAMTANGSFFSANTAKFVEALQEDELNRYRGVCMKYGFRSLVVIPIRYRDSTIGAVHLADEREGLIAKDNVEFLEQLAHILGEAVYRFTVEEDQARLVLAVESSADAVAITDRRGCIRYVNPAFEQITGYRKEEVLNQTLHLLDSGKQDEAFYSRVREAIARDSVWRGRLWSRKKDGTLYLEDCTYSPVRDATGAVINYVSLKRDVTESARLETIAESVNLMNNIGYIFSGVRHEIGNPINSAKMILSVLQLKLGTAPPDVIKGYVDSSLAQIGRVEHLLRNLKNYNLYERPELRDLELAVLLQEVRSLIAGDLEQKGIAFSLEVPEAAGRVRVDPRAFQQVLINLVTNAADAVQGRPAPRIRMTAAKEAGTVHLFVADNGAGMTAQQQQDLFKPFYTSKPGGTGLGLVIVKKMLSGMNCGIVITSVPEEGTQVDISIPEAGREG